MKTNTNTASSICVALLASAASLTAAPIQWTIASGGNDHFYDFIVAPSIGWNDAEAASLLAGGTLATITSSAENAFIAANVPGSMHYFWLGAYQPIGSPEPAGGFTWVTGESFTYTNWHPGEPNNLGGNEQYVEFDGVVGQWNDQSLGRTSDFGYVVENVPEPSSALLLLSGAALCLRRRSLRTHERNG